MQSTVYEGYHQFLDKMGERYGSFEIFRDENGWQWWACFPGCLPDGEAVGPFNTAREAFYDALRS